MSTLSAHRRARLSNIIAAQAAAVIPDTKLEITELRQFPVREPASGRAYSIVRVRTRGGLTGFAEGPTVAESQFARTQQYWTGKAASSYMTSGAPLALSGAVDMALLDIIGRASNAPVYRVLGGPTRNKVRALTTASLSRAAAAGFRAIVVAAPKPAARNQGQAYERDLRQLLEPVRAAGAQIDFVLDGDGQLTPGDAANVAMTLEPMHPLCFDDPIAVLNARTIRKIADESAV